MLDLSRLLPGPYCTLLLADLGASVDKVEDPHAGDYLRHVPSGWPARAKGLSGKFVALNRDKRSVVLDLKQEAGRETILRLVRRYDVLVESFRPGVMDRLGLGSSSLLAENPRLVICAIAGYSKTGPYRQRAAHDLNTVGLSGVLRGGGDCVPTVPPYPLSDLAAGLNAATAICAALYAAQKTGRGRHLDVSMSESALGFSFPALADLGAAPDSETDVLSGGQACYRVYRTRDERFVTVAALEPKFWQAFNDTIGRTSSADDLSASPVEQQRMYDEIQAVLITKTRDEWADIFSSVEGCCEPVLTPRELAEHPLSRDTFVELGGAKWPATALQHLSGRTTHTSPPTQGQQSAQILAEAGFTVDEVAALVASRVTR